MSTFSVDAPLKHLTKYLSDYAELYPHALQVLTMTKQSIYWTRRGKKVRRIYSYLYYVFETLFVIAGHCAPDS